MSDAYITEVVVILKKECEDKLPWAVEQLQKTGLTVSSADDDNSVVEGCIETSRVHALENLGCVNYVRKVFSYVADFPAGDPRDTDAREPGS